MSKLVSLLALGVALSIGATAHAADEKSGLTKQQSKMTICNMEAGELKGDQRKAFITLSGIGQLVEVSKSRPRVKRQCL